MTEHPDLLAWALSEQASAHEQIDLFGTNGVKALLLRPDGTTEDITSAVSSHQRRNLAVFEQLISILEG